MRNKPAVGDKVRVKDHWTECELTGTVKRLLSEQFSWEDDVTKKWYITHYKGDWTYESGEVRG